MIWRAILGGLWRPLAWAFGGLALWIAGRRSGTVAAGKRGLQNEVNAHERINDADTGIGATDGERIERLREFADKHGN